MPLSNPPSPHRAIAWGRVVPAVAFMAVALVVCGGLGWWQWQRASEQATTVAPAPPVPIAEVLTPGVSAGPAIGRQVTVTGRWADADSALVWGREVDGEDAVFLVRSLTIDPDHTGTGQPATIAVLVGWRPASEPVGVDHTETPVTVTGYLRSGEASGAGAAVPNLAIDGIFSVPAISTAQFAQVWDGPLYPAVLVSYEGSRSWAVLPPREPETSMDFRSVAYAIEWWIFGAFAVFIAARWIRDNGRTPTVEDAGQSASEENVEA